MAKEIEEISHHIGVKEEKIRMLKIALKFLEKNTPNEQVSELVELLRKENN